ncbi:hypothetical protein FDECE_6338 [Fusarium decemcellulare]|nr:hypothetical protein FDECE_6338 [Fusarium decemcellulare]
MAALSAHGLPGQESSMPSKSINLRGQASSTALWARIVGECEALSGMRRMDGSVATKDPCAIVGFVRPRNKDLCHRQQTRSPEFQVFQPPVSACAALRSTAKHSTAPRRGTRCSWPSTTTTLCPHPGAAFGPPQSGAVLVILGRFCPRTMRRWRRGRRLLSRLGADIRKLTPKKVVVSSGASAVGAAPGQATGFAAQTRVWVSEAPTSRLSTVTCLGRRIGSGSIEKRTIVERLLWYGTV